MRPKRSSELLLGATRAKAKMFEYGVDEEHHIHLHKDPARLFTLTIGLLGEYTAGLNRESLSEARESDLKADLRFAAYFFDSYLQSRLDMDLQPYLLLLGSASYYLCDLPGSSNVLAMKLDFSPNLGASGLECLLLWLLRGEFLEPLRIEGIYSDTISLISQKFASFWRSGQNPDVVESACQELRNITYSSGTSRELLFSDVILAIVKKRITNSCWSSLPVYTGLTTDAWRTAIQKESFVKELWPAQHLLGEKGIFSGESGIVQMPTSAGKTRAIEIIIRAAFISERTSLAVIVAPFRALCHEIKNNLHDTFIDEDVKVNEMTDVPIFDFEFDFETLLTEKQVLIVTPEKLLYILRHEPEISNDIGLVIYDEGHQFDNGSRGINYELLLTSLKHMISKETQVVLISAVISNAATIGEWLIGENSVNVDGTHLTPTFRTLAFASWIHQLGRLEFVSNHNPEVGEFFVPRIIEPLQLQRKGRERKERSFPEEDDNQSIALFLALKLVYNGTVALFIGRKSTASTVGEKLIDIYSRGVALIEPRVLSDEEEVNKLCKLIELNLGTDALETKCANLGVFIHHGNIPQGIRLAIEYALKETKIKIVICTSTLAQGVNMPVRYLIVTSLYQGSQKIKIRDFHNLMGRAGRSGMYTEGSIIFADPNIYDKKRDPWKKWRWEQAKEALNPSNSEPCLSTLFSLLEPIESDDGKYIFDLNVIEIIQTYYNSFDEFDELKRRIASEDGFSSSGVERQFSEKTAIISSVESFIMTNWDSQDYEEDRVAEITKRTLAYFLGTDSQKLALTELFKEIARNVHFNVTSNEKKQIFGKTLFGLKRTSDILEWLRQNISDLLLCKDIIGLVDVVWPLIYENIDNNTFNKCAPPELIKGICLRWVSGETYKELFEEVSRAGIVLSGKRQRGLKMEDLIEICDNSLSYEGALILAAVIELLPLVSDEELTDTLELIKEFQIKLKYGLPSRKAVTFYELGFSDRVIAQHLTELLGEGRSGKRASISQLRNNGEAITNLLADYPTYFQIVLQQYLT